MRTFRQASPLSEPHGDEEIDRFTLSYIAGLARDRFHQLVLSAFEDSGLSKRQLAKRLGMDPSRVSKILNTSSNMTVETLGAVMFAIDGSVPTAARNWPLRENTKNLREPTWLGECLDSARIIKLIGNTDQHLTVSTKRYMTLATTAQREIHEDA